MALIPDTGREIVYALTWWVVLEGAGLLVLPLAFRLFRHLPDRGYALSKPLGLIVVNYTLWMLGTLGFLRNSWGNILVSSVLCLVAGVFLYHRETRQRERTCLHPGLRPDGLLPGV